MIVRMLFGRFTSNSHNPASTLCTSRCEQPTSRLTASRSPRYGGRPNRFNDPKRTQEEEAGEMMNRKVIRAGQPLTFNFSS